MWLPKVQKLGRQEKVWWRQRDSNPRPQRCERCALPAELCPHEKTILGYLGIEDGILLLPHLRIFDAGRIVKETRGRFQSPFYNLGDLSAGRFYLRIFIAS